LSTLLRCFAKERNSTPFFSWSSALFHKNTGVWGTPLSTWQPLSTLSQHQRPHYRILV
jgi:hypothetical protein